MLCKLIAIRILHDELNCSMLEDFLKTRNYKKRWSKLTKSALLNQNQVVL